MFLTPVIPQCSFWGFLSAYELIWMLLLPLMEHSDLIDYVLSRGLGDVRAWARVESNLCLPSDRSAVIRVPHMCVKNKSRSRGNLIRWFNPGRWCSVLTKLARFDGNQNRRIS